MPGNLDRLEGAVRVVLCTRGGLPGARVLERLLASPNAEVAGIVLSTRVDGPRRGWLAGAIRRVHKSGLAYGAYLWASTAGADLAALGRNPASVRSRAARAGIPLHATRQIGDDAGRAFIAACRPDVLASAFFDQHVDERTRAIAPRGAVNIHPSVLPDFRGVDPVFHALLRGAQMLGVTVHRMVDAWDAGPILASEASAPIPGESVLGATARLYERGAVMLAEGLPRIAAGDPGSAQGGEGCYDSWPGRADVTALSRRRIALVRVDDLLKR
ncbi:MAG TPA: formyltransferase family protein [Usitatibacter sp.]|nr:formyltransferase family protein [Usitatibacter sp.]